MKSVHCTFLFYLFFVYSCGAEVINLNSSNWNQVLEGEWFVEFFAPWCPACRQFGPVWEALSKTPEVTAKVAAVDVTESPVLSFVFFVERLPTIYYVKDGNFRVYDGLRKLQDLIDYVNSGYYTSVTPVPWYYSPASYHMRVFVQFMNLGLAITRLHQSLLDAGFKPWMSFIMIGVSTIVCGLFLGLIMVVVFDCFFPPRPQILRLFGKTRKPKEDDLTNSADVPSEPQKEPSSDLSESESELRQRSKDSKEEDG